MSLLDELVTKYNFDKINALTRYPSILDYHQIEDEKATNKLATRDYQPIPPQPEKMPIVIKELVDGDVIRIISIDNDFFIGDNTDMIHARGDRIISNPRIVPMYKALNSFFGANMTNNERLMVLIAVCYGGELSPIYKSNEIKCVLLEGYTLKLNDVISLCRDNEIEAIQKWVDTLHQPFWSIKTLTRFCTACNLEPLPILKETTLNSIPTEITDMKELINQYKYSSLFTETEVKTKENKKLDTKTPTINIDDIEKDDDIEFLFNNKIPSKGIVIRSLDRTYIRKVNFKHYL